jgi:N-methylhydantoinase A/oxoprolinase/acetone carboxylase beta subunit
MVVLGVDVGGTNTDLIMSGVEGPGVVVHKLPTTKDDPARATVEGTLELCAMAGLGPAPACSPRRASGTSSTSAATSGRTTSR